MGGYFLIYFGLCFFGQALNKRNCYSFRIKNKVWKSGSILMAINKVYQAKRDNVI